MEYYHLSEDDVLFEEPEEKNMKESEITHFIQENAIPVNDFSALPSEMSPFLSDRKIILIGESLHGTNDGPEMALGLLKNLCQLGKPLILAIEVWSSEQNTFDRFMQTGDLEILRSSSFFKNTPQCGLGSLALVELLQKIRFMPNMKVFCFDPFNQQMIEASNKMADISISQDRDRGMAYNLLEKIKERDDAVVVVLTGSLHASTAMTSFLDSDYEPMGYLLTHQEKTPLEGSEVLSILMKFEKGSAWCGLSVDNGENITFGVHEIAQTIDVYTQAVNWKGYFLPNNPFEKGYHAVLFTRTISPSYPLQF